MKRKPNAIPAIPHPEIRSRMLTVKKMLEAPLEGALGYTEGGSEQYLDLFLSRDVFIVGDIQQTGDVCVANIHQLEVSKMLRGKGIGARLFKGFVAEAKALGAQELWSESVSNMALGLRAKIFGEAALQFYDAEQQDVGFLPLTVQQAQMSNQRVIDAFVPDSDWSDPGDLGVYVDLSHVDTEGWARPDMLHCQDLGLVAS